MSKRSAPKREAVLFFIKEAGKVGRTFGEIQRFIVEELSHLDYDEMSKVTIWKNGGTRGSYSYHSLARRYRGYWNTTLCGGGFNNCYGKGILKTYCKKNVNNRWVFCHY